MIHTMGSNAKKAVTTFLHSLPTRHLPQKPMKGWKLQERPVHHFFIIAGEQVVLRADSHKSWPARRCTMKLVWAPGAVVRREARCGGRIPAKVFQPEHLRSRAGAKQRRAKSRSKVATRASLPTTAQTNFSRCSLMWPTGVASPVGA